ncbi:hypothetical protein CDO28_20095 (plasmid) [Sinorhizobium meliloti]|uniref:hypothetical protein n=1 Tax=Rhizobium meliloti TaxID=382 RepID=UPI000B49B814|nr:hypothetical protein [Sinorhizobium meliloti]ASP73855.1 hypothetical protein CDO28_20095 [Sinorhizobium meliloti]MDE3858104.1 hypothetical protein [Sinorhizobium meliloti]MQW53412.1 hypothetical protein [Sinorhizobium meliloti]
MSWIKASFGVALALAWSSGACFGAEDVDPMVSPNRLDDVADASGSPFPRFDNFSWRAFIALNWPSLTEVNHRGEPDTTKSLADSGPRVWETYKARYEVFAPGAARPAEWNSFDGSNPCGGAVSNDKKTLSSFSHFADFNQAALSLSNVANPLIAQNRTYTRYEVRFNREQFDTIVANEWYVKSKQPTPDAPGSFKDGSIEVKAAWRILTVADQAVRDRFYVSPAFVFDPQATAETGSVVCKEQSVALVGLHIVAKTKLRPQWIWSSFEHIDNVPPHDIEPDAANSHVPYSYNSGKPPATLHPPTPPKAISADNLPLPAPDPMQVVRKQGIRAETMALNQAYWELPGIKGTVWANYMLVMTQWPSTPIPQSPEHSGSPFPTGVESTTANTTMETYQQRNGRSCMECHNAISNAKGLDFVAFMAMDAVDPPQQALARTAISTIATLDATDAAQKAPLDDDPTVQSLVDFLKQE